VISLLSGHLGGANQWAKELATLLAADPVVTTATDTEQVQSVGSSNEAIKWLVS
jgi:cobalt-precorrin 5A hydrolase